MIPTAKRALGATLAAAVLSAGFAAQAFNLFPHKAPARPPASAPASQAPAPEPHATGGDVDIPIDPALRVGRLENGMRYVIMKNATPPGQASLRLRIAAGSLMEKDDQQGLMHVIEHMAFEGSTGVPRGEMIKILQRHGLAFGPDTNAFTNFDQTVYQLDLPQNDDDSITTGLMLMRETAGNLLLDQGALDTEKGIVLSEERLRDTPALRLTRKQFDFFYKDQLPPRRFPIGQVPVIQGAKKDQLSSLYRTWYRPDRATLVAVGDFDVDKMEARIKADFSDWRAAAPDSADPSVGAVEKRGTETKLAVEPGGPNSISLAWVTPPDLRADSQAVRREKMIRDLAFAVLNRRLERLARGDDAPFIAAGAFHGTSLKTADITQLQVNAQPGKWKEAMQAAVAEERRAVQFGVQQAELDREIAESRAELQTAVEGAPTRKTPELANSIVDNINDRQVVTSPAEDLREFEAAVKDLKAATVSAALKSAFSGEGPLVFVASTTPLEGGEQAIAQAFSQDQLAQVTPPSAVQTKTWAYTDFGSPGKVADRKEVLDLDTTFVRFENGVRLTVKPTKFRDDQVLISVRVGDGYLDLPKDRWSPIWAAGLSLPEGGLGQLTAEELEQVLASKVYSVGMGVTDDAFALTGVTRKDDFETQMQVLTAYLSDAAWRPEPFERMRAYSKTLLTQLASTPGGVFSLHGAALLRSGDPRWAYPTESQIEQAKLADLKNLIGPSLKNGPVEVVIVGDVDVDQAIQTTAETFGALPPRTPAGTPSADARKVSFPAPTAEPVKLYHHGRADQAVAFVAWPTTDFPSDPQGARALRALEQTLQLRLIDTFRLKEAVTYSPSTDLQMAWDFPGWGYVAASIEVPPDKLDGFFTTVQAIAKDLRDKPISADELERAVKPRIERILKEQQTNEYWVAQLSGAQSDPRKLDAIRTSVPGMQRVTSADVQKAAQTWLRDDKAWKLEIVPEIKTASK